MHHKHSGFDRISGFELKETELYFVVILLEYLYRKGSMKSSSNVDEIILIKNEIEKYIWNDLKLVLCSFCYSEMDQGQSWPRKVISIQVEVWIISSRRSKLTFKSDRKTWTRIFQTVLANWNRNKLCQNLLWFMKRYVLWQSFNSMKVTNSDKSENPNWIWSSYYKLWFVINFLIMFSQIIFKN